MFDRVHENYTAMAHNAKAFDGVFVQKWLIENRPTADIHVIHSGQKIMQLTIRDYKTRLIDSLNFSSNASLQVSYNVRLRHI